jgi:hypothetical protein
VGRGCLFKEGKMDHITVVLVAIGMAVFDQPTLAQSRLSGLASAQSNLDSAPPDQNKCRHTQGKLVEVYVPEKKTAFGKLRNSEWLDGTTATVDSSAPFPTADLNKVSFSSTLTYTTHHGQLKGKILFIFDVITGLGAGMSDIDGSASTGIFAGATGVLFLNGFKADTVAQGPYYSVVYARICFAPGNEPPDR